MIDIKYKNFNISTGYSFSGKTKHYIIWTKYYIDAVPLKFRSIKKAKMYINNELK
jgi:hypothetical protein